MPKRIHILCVEDEPEVLDAVVKDLSWFEDLFPVETARSVTEARTAVARIQEEKDALALVLCDHIMPGENGVEFLIELYRDPFTATSRKILLTGQAGLDATVRAVNFANLDFYIGKPWRKDELIAAVKHQLKAYILAHGREVQKYALLFGERELAEAMMSKFPGTH
jgi:CheY-like chemotaxis protein